MERIRFTTAALAAAASVLAVLPAARACFAAAPPGTITGGADSAAAASTPDGPVPYVSPRNYRIAPGDTLQIVVVNHTAANFTQAVDPDGTINYPHAGILKVAGHTTRDIEEVITDVLTGTDYQLTETGVKTGKSHPDRAYYLHPEVRAYVTGRLQRTVNVIGTGVKTTAQLPIKENWRVFDALAAVGFTTDRPEFFDAKLFRPAAEGSADPPQIFDLDLGHVLAQDPSADPKKPGTIGNIPLLPDDTVVVNTKDESQTTVQVIGQVTKPGPITCPANGSIASVLGDVQPTPTALLSAAKIERGGMEIPVDLSSWLRDGKIDANVTLQPGDRLVIPENQRFYYIYGPTGHSGTIVYPTDRKLTLLSAWADSGGQTEGLELNAVQVIRPSTTGGAPQVQKVNLNDIVRKGDIHEDVPIQPGDIIYMPPAHRSHGIDPFRALGVLNIIPSLILLGQHL